MGPAKRKIQRMIFRAQKKNKAINLQKMLILMENGAKFYLLERKVTKRLNKRRDRRKNGLRLLNKKNYKYLNKK